MRQDNLYKMVDVGPKVPTHRKATAEGRISMSREAFLYIKEKRLPKGDAIALSQAAGIMAAKQTSNILPLCHPLPLDKVSFDFTLDKTTNSVIVNCTAQATAKTGVEMEALSGVNTALLCIYDLTKGICPALIISDIRLCVKEGGKSGLWVHPDLRKEEAESLSLLPKSSITNASNAGILNSLEGIRVAVLTLSDSTFSGKREDASGKILTEFLGKRNAEIVVAKVLPDEQTDIEEFLRYYSSTESVDVVLCTGGTGLGPRDITPEAVMNVSDRIIPGIGESLRFSGAQATTKACLSRSVAAMARNTLIIALPGSSRAVIESLLVLEEILSHAVSVIRGANHDSPVS